MCSVGRIGLGPYVREGPHACRNDPQSGTTLFTFTALKCAIQVRTLNDFRPTAGKRRGAPPRPSCETTASTPAAAREAPKFSSALRAVAVVAVVECRYTYVAAQLSCRKKVHVARKNAAGRLESARRCVSKDVALQVWGRIRHKVFALLCWPTVMTPSRHRRLVLAYDSNPSSDGSVLVSATPPARHHYCPPTPLRPRPHPQSRVESGHALSHSTTCHLSTS